MLSLKRCRTSDGRSAWRGGRWAAAGLLLLLLAGGLALLSARVGAQEWPGPAEPPGTEPPVETEAPATPLPPAVAQFNAALREIAQAQERLDDAIMRLQEVEQPPEAGAGFFLVPPEINQELELIRVRLDELTTLVPALPLPPEEQRLLQETLAFQRDLVLLVQRHLPAALQLNLMTPALDTLNTHLMDLGVADDEGNLSNAMLNLPLLQ